jgi:hypothetical protein
MDVGTEVTQLTPELKKSLASISTDVDVVFVVDQDGKVTIVSQAESTKSAENVRFPRPEDEISWTKSITVFKYKNPSTCIIIGGTQRCY